MIIATYKQRVNGNEYVAGYLKEYTSVYKDKSQLLDEMKQGEEKGNPMIISGIWELS